MAKLILKSVEAAVVHVKEGVIENNEQNGGSFVSWANGEPAVLTYIDGQLASLADGVSEAEVSQAVDLWLKGEVAFDKALSSGRDFINWTDKNEITREVADRLIKAGRHADAPDWSDDYGGEYLTTLRDGSVVVWGRELTDGRELIVLTPEQVTIGTIDVPEWSADA